MDEMQFVEVKSDMHIFVLSTSSTIVHLLLTLISAIPLTPSSAVAVAVAFAVVPQRAQHWQDRKLGSKTQRNERQLEKWLSAKST